MFLIQLRTSYEMQYNLELNQETWLLEVPSGSD